MERRSGTRNWLIVVVVLLLAGVAAYFVGSAIEHGARTREVASAKAQLQRARTQVASLQSVNHLLTADMWAYRAAAALDNRNFGVANDAIGQAVTSLSRVDAASAGLDEGALASLKTEAAGIKISVAINLESQRTQLLRLATDITALTDRSTGRPESNHG